MRKAFGLWLLSGCLPPWDLPEPGDSLDSLADSTTESGLDTDEVELALVGRFTVPEDAEVPGTVAARLVPAVGVTDGLLFSDEAWLHDTLLLVEPGDDREVSFVMDAAVPPADHLLTVDGGTFAVYRWELWADANEDQIVDPGEALIGSSVLTLLAYAVEGAIPSQLADIGVIPGWNVVSTVDGSPGSAEPLLLGESAFTMAANLAPVVRPSLSCLAMDPLVSKVIGLQEPGQYLEPLLFPFHAANISDETSFDLLGFDTPPLTLPFENEVVQGATLDVVVFEDANDDLVPDNDTLFAVSNDGVEERQLTWYKPLNFDAAYLPEVLGIRMGWSVTGNGGAGLPPVISWDEGVVLTTQ